MVRDHASAVWDYVIVGAGSAGCALAYRLGEDPSLRILVLEAGAATPNLVTKIPGIHKVAWDLPNFNWSYVSEPNPAINGRTLPVPRGKVVGGCSTINGTAYIRGHRAGYDAWADSHGCEGWSFADVLPYFRRAESSWTRESPYHGTSGPVPVIVARSAGKHFPMISDAVRQAGYPVSADCDGSQQDGIGPMTNNASRGRRFSSAVAYLAPAIKRGNVKVLTGAQATRIILEGRRAAGIAYRHEGRDETAMAAREIILSGGAYNSPQLLMLSGIGDSRHLHALGITPAVDRPGVGQNLQEHPLLYVSFDARESFLINLRVDRLARNMVRCLVAGTGPMADNGGVANIFLRSNADCDRPDIQLIATTIRGDAKPWLARPQNHRWTWCVSAVRPYSRGSVTLGSADALASPRIALNLLGDQRDMDAMVGGVTLMREIMAQEALKPLIVGEAIPGPSHTSRDQLEAFVRHNAEIMHHPVGTCRMGSDDEAVVDTQLRVRGVEGLRIADASVMPEIPGANTNAAATMIGERAADIVRGRSLAPEFQKDSVK